MPVFGISVVPGAGWLVWRGGKQRKGVQDSSLPLVGTELASPPPLPMATSGDDAASSAADARLMLSEVAAITRPAAVASDREACGGGLRAAPDNERDASLLRLCKSQAARGHHYRRTRQRRILRRARQRLLPRRVLANARPPR